MTNKLSQHEATCFEGSSKSVRAALIHTVMVNQVLTMVSWLHSTHSPPASEKETANPGSEKAAASLRTVTVLNGLFILFSLRKQGYLTQHLESNCACSVSRGNTPEMWMRCHVPSVCICTAYLGTAARSRSLHQARAASSWCKYGLKVERTPLHLPHWFA